MSVKTDRPRCCCRCHNAVLVQFAAWPMNLNVTMTISTAVLLYTGLERLQQLLDALTDVGHVVRQHVYRVDNITDAFDTLKRLDKRPDDKSKHILIDLPTVMTEQVLNRQVCITYYSLYTSLRNVPWAVHLQGYLLVDGVRIG